MIIFCIEIQGKVWHGRLTPPPLKEFIKQRIDCGIGTRSVSRGDWEVPNRQTSFGQKVLSVMGSKYFNSLPQSIPQCSSLRNILRSV